MKLPTALLIVTVSLPVLLQCTVSVRTPRVYVAPPPPPNVQVEVGTQPAPPAPPPPEEAAAPAAEYTDDDPSALTDFHDALDAHGQWVEDSRYGTVWVPNAAEVGPDFVPYTSGGHWAYDNDDYVWASDYDWGWAPFHYGRWVTGDRGWSWVPGRVYAPAWVTWSTGDPGFAYVGWAPAPPAFYWRGGVYSSVTWNVEPRWGYVGSGNLFEAHLGGRVLRGNAAASISGRMHPFLASGGGAAGGGAGVGGHAKGPAPASVGVPAGKVTHISASDPSFTKAKSFSNPASALKLGAHLPTRGGASGATASTPTSVRPEGHIAGSTTGRTTGNGASQPTSVRPEGHVPGSTPVKTAPTASSRPAPSATSTSHGGPPKGGRKH